MLNLFLVTLLWLGERLPLPAAIVLRPSTVVPQAVVMVLFLGLVGLSGCNVSPQPLGLPGRQLPGALTSGSGKLGPGRTKSPLEHWFQPKGDSRLTLQLADELLANITDPFLIKLPLPPGAIPLEEMTPTTAETVASANGGSGTGVVDPINPTGNPTGVLGETAPVINPVQLLSLAGISYSATPGKTMAIVQNGTSSQFIRQGETFYQNGSQFAVEKIGREFAVIAAVDDKGKRGPGTRLTIASIIGYQSTTTPAGGSSSVQIPGSSLNSQTPDLNQALNQLPPNLGNLLNAAGQ